MHRRINITLPADTIRLLNRVTTKGNRSKFIAAAVRRYAQEAYRQDLDKRLKEGALRWAERDRQVAEEWFDLEEEVCRENRKR